MWLSKEECDFGRRVFTSIIVGSIVGWERREKDRPAGIRTMALVSMGSCIFTITSAHAFIHGPMTWDASRVAAAIPSGVGFLGAGLIWKQAAEDDDGTPTQVIHGLTTAASLWLSAALGIACGEFPLQCGCFMGLPGTNGSSRIVSARRGNVFLGDILCGYDAPDAALRASPNRG